MDYALVTGATSGIGLAITRKLLSENVFVYINYANSDDRADALARELNESSGNLKFIKSDMSEYAGINTLISTLGRTSLKYLVLNCGITDRTPFGEISVENWEKVMRTNVNIPFFLLQSLYDNIQECGAVCCISSLMATFPHASSVSYGVSKAALSALCKNMIKYLSSKGIRINAIEPGFIDTPWQREKPFDQRARIEKRTALNRFGQPDEVADMCWAVLNNKFVNGAIIPVCGGYCMA